MPKLVYPDSCPECGDVLHRSRRRGWIEKVLNRIFRIGVFRCHRCGTRFYSPPAVIVHAPSDPSASPAQDTAVEDIPGPVIIEPEAPSPVETIVVKIAPVSEKDLPVTGQTWTQQAVGNRFGDSSAVWIHSSTAHPGGRPH